MWRSTERSPVPASAARWSSAAARFGRLLPLLGLVVGAALLPRTSPAQADATPPPDYARKVAPLLTRYCAGCHNDQDREGDFSLETFASLQQGTPKGPALLAGDAEGSRILRLITGQAEPRMPPAGEPRPSDEEVALLKAWIEAGAKGPADGEPSRPRLIVPRIASQARQHPVTALAASPDARWLAVGRYATVSLYRVPEDSGMPEGDPVRELTDFPGKVTALHFSRDGSQLVVASGIAGLAGDASLWNVEDGSLRARFEGHRDLLYDAELSPDGTTLATCGYDRNVEIWDVNTAKRLRVLSGHNGAVYDVAFSPDGQFLVSGSADDTCKVWRVSDGMRMDTLSQPLKEVYSCLFTPDGRQIVAAGADNNIRVWRFVSRDKPRINPMVEARFAHEGPIVRLALTADGTRLVSVAEDRAIKVWSTADYRELRLWGEQPEVSMSVAVSADGRELFLGRMDGTLARFALPSAAEVDRPSGDALPGTLATTEAAPPTASQPPHAIVEQEPNGEPGQAQPISLPARITGVVQAPADGPADADLFRFQATAGQQWVLEINAQRSKSPLDSYLEVLDADGRRLERVLLQAVRDSYFTFRGKDDTTVDDFRVFNWQEMRLDEYLYANGEVVKLWLYPRGPDSGFMVYPGQGKRWGYFDTTPLSHALGEPCYIVRAHPPGTQLIPNGLPVFPLYYENDDASQRDLGKDSRLLFTAPRDGSYLVKVKDVRGFSGADFKYTLEVRPRRPDFEVTLHGANPTVPAGGSREFRLTARRIDGFEGPIRVDIQDLPPGFTATSPVVIEAGQIEALGVITAAADAQPPTESQSKAGRMTATASIGSAEVTRDVNPLGQVKLGPAPKFQVAILPAEGGAQPLASSTSGWPEYEIHPGETIMLKVRVDRQGYAGQVPFGKEGAGRNLPFGVYIDNLGLNGLLILEDQQERNFFVTADASVPEQSRLFHLNPSAEGGLASQPVMLHIRRQSERN